MKFSNDDFSVLSKVDTYSSISKIDYQLGTELDQRNLSYLKWNDITYFRGKSV